jgi:hypothetical protein
MSPLITHALSLVRSVIRTPRPQRGCSHRPPSAHLRACGPTEAIQQNLLLANCDEFEEIGAVVAYDRTSANIRAAAAAVRALAGRPPRHPRRRHRRRHRHRASDAERA